MALGKLIWRRISSGSPASAYDDHHDHEVSDDEFYDDEFYDDDDKPDQL